MSKDVKSRVEQFAARLEGALGANLVSLLEFGATARGDHTPRSDVNLLLIVRDASARALQPAAPAIAQWTARGETAPLIFGEGEWRDAADVFPIEVEDMRAAHRVVHGVDPLDGLVTTRDNMRHQLEREVRGKLLHLRAEYAAAAPDRKALERLLLSAASTFLVFFRATLRLKGVTPPGDPKALAKQVAAAVGFDPAPFDWVLDRRAGLAAPSLQAFDPLASSYVDAIERLAGAVNQL